ncbi:polyprenyl synthetase family protein [Ornithinimicrobium sediminis]|uniref:polyprenyl synthetase family protein n=1 Tax=Ornithinimicrobium sediminis TaxID=2904603 RepID=UPI0038CD9430
MSVPVIPDIDGALQDRLVAGMADVQRRLQEVIAHDDGFIAEAAGHLAQAGGKRFRPLLTLLCAEVGEGRNDRVVDAAVGVELTHLASLYHDDVMDEAELRRGVQSANLRYGNAVSILIGDLLFGTASSVIADLGPEAVKVQARTFVRLCSGQIRDERAPAADADPADYYLGVLADKTGSLIATAAWYGATFGGCDARTRDILTSYAEKLGVVFQLADDLLDVSSEAADSGKTPGTDLREGKATLPVLYARGSTDPGDSRLRELLAGPIGDADEVAEAVALLRVHPAMEQARQHTQQVADEARALLADLPDQPPVRALRALVDGVADRSA